MTDQERKAMKMALNALKFSQNMKRCFARAEQDYHEKIAPIAIKHLEDVLAQSDNQEPVAWMGITDNPYCNDADCNDPNSRAMRWHNKLLELRKQKYTAPPSKPFVFLTKEDMPSGDHPMYDTKEFYAGMAWAQTKLKEKNT